jgi:hypothetical protein
MVFGNVQVMSLKITLAVLSAISFLVFFVCALILFYDLNGKFSH